ncbi:helix-turn-helix transcriptional regulator [Petroclostridium sp. X23]|uniref:helix-turn-helix domain-containing protein n=1 Tax=Petroclostridium sp. X23 TaxID=3045146 RepID=UPI0024AE451D|nr:helix-turn-helix transcriptional regulator [Petroclostridium sp. X23]WHH58275.1 helix-turn-helix transcriptional regulator [Petroclostridium sp. X23]
MNFAKRLKELRLELNLTQSEFAEKINSTRSTIAGYETERKEPDYSTLQSIAEFFDVSVDYLIGRTDIRNHYKIETKAYHNLDKSGLPEEAIKQIEDYIEFVKQKYNPDGTLKKKG